MFDRTGSGHAASDQVRKGRRERRGHSTALLAALVAGSRPGGRAPGANRVIIRALGVDAPLVPESIADGELAIPEDVHTVGRSSAGASVDATQGTTLLAGHVNAADQGAGALSQLYRIAPGAVIVVIDAHARPTVWRVVSLRTIAKEPNSLPSSIFSATGRRQLAILTCGGTLLRVDGPHGAYNTYRDNILAIAAPVSSG